MNNVFVHHCEKIKAIYRIKKNDNTLSYAMPGFQESNTAALHTTLSIWRGQFRTLSLVVIVNSI